MTNDKFFLKKFYYDQVNAVKYMEYTGMQALDKCNFDNPHVCCKQNVFDKLRSQKEQSLRDAIISCGYLPEQVIDDRVRQERQQRVFDEASELTLKIDKLKLFINSEKFASVDKQEQIRMIQQLGYMTSYLKILTQRIDNFK